jgi:[glutamine synthetase] adenylyltransferase / [glutamine synthetase]-adenylyl-L-tyrosine phosphorylase
MRGQLHPCGPVVDAEAAERSRERLGEAAREAWPALAPVFAASPYLASLAIRRPERLTQALAADPVERARALCAQASSADGSGAEVGRTLRELKADLHLTLALADVGGVIHLDAVTRALSDFADAALRAALRAVARDQAAKGRLAAPEDPDDPVPGLFCLAMGKHGAHELNYSSDIDVSVFYEPRALPGTGKLDPQTLAVQITQALAVLMQQRTVEGYVFRVDLRLRPDPGATPSAVPVEAALDYYESVGQNWERAAFIKARPAAGDRTRAEAFLAEMQPFIWRRHLDYAAIADIQAIKRQIHVHKADERLTAPGADLKLGAGGIREIEFYAQTQQLILGGRDPGLRAPRTLDALEALRAAGHVSDAAAADLADAYVRLRGWEHRVQMIADEQTHRLPERDEDRRRVAALSGHGDLAAFDAEVEAVLRRVNGRYGELFAAEEDLSSEAGSLVFTGVDDDPETLRTLERMGFGAPAQVAATIRGWHHGRIAATRTARGRELFTRLAPRLLDAARATGAPDPAFNRFADFFTRLSSGVQLQSLFLAQPELFQLVVEVMAFAPEMAATLARKPAAIDALMDRSFFAPLGPDVAAPLRQAVAAADGFEGAMNAARRVWREQAFRVGLQVMSGSAGPGEAGAAYAALADACVAALAPAALAEAERLGGAFEGEVAVIALGKFGSREMTARSDLDLMTLYKAPTGALSATKGWAAETFYARFTQRLIAALSAPTGEGGLYEVDLQLRPSGTKGPVAVSCAAFEGYYAEEAQTWEHLALTRARVAWSTSAAFAGEAQAAIEQALRRPRDIGRAAADVVDMRDLMTRERPPSGFWDLKLGPGGLVDVEFAAQFLQLAGAAADGPLRVNTGEALRALVEAGATDAGTGEALLAGWSLASALSQVLKVALPEGADPEQEPARLQTMLAAAGDSNDLAELKGLLAARRGEARAALERVLGASLA